MTKVVITAAGKGTRLLPFTKEMPKEMMPIFSNESLNRDKLFDPETELRSFPPERITPSISKLLK